ncbi:MAG TPA: type III-B CRISPR module-associated Cmr3 family protein [Myxococcota bacterium]|nr:type III-B CRISPR module-associated Cmr3 family protein [Myxococcota bacterium]
MNTWRLDPLDPLIFGNGKPATNGAAIESLPLPWPTTVAGAFRTRAGSPKGFWDEKLLTPDKAKELVIQGPLLTRQEKNGAWKLLVPAPADALLLEPKPENDGQPQKPIKNWSQATRRRLQVLKKPEGVQTSLGDNRLPVGLSPYDPAKPYGKAPPLWTWEELETWLGESKEVPNKLDHLPEEAGNELPVVVRRVHVGIAPETQRAADGLLFTTEARDFSAKKKKNDEGDTWSAPLSFVLWADHAVTPGIGQLGGERRMVRWEQDGPETPQPSVAMRQKLLQSAQKGHLRVQLLTPALFPGGSTWTPPEGVEVVAQISGRPHPVSGWDLVLRGPKKMERLVPAGSVYFVKITKTEMAEALIKKWWFQSICTGQAQHDGLGLAVVGCWDGPVPFEMRKEQ